MEQRFLDRSVLITGGSRGIGLAAARAFASEGARVALFATNEERLAEASASIDGSIAIRGDVRSSEDCERAVAEVARAHGGLDVLVNSAGVIFRDRPIETMPEDEWDRTFDINVKGVFLMCKHALPALRESHGVIVNLSSYVGLVGFAGAAAYAASKAAIVNFTRSLALDHAPDGIRVNSVCPGSVGTDMIFAAWNAKPDPEVARQQWEKKHPLGRIAEPEEVACAILFLASTDAAFITGAALPVDGGITAG